VAEERGSAAFPESSRAVVPPVCFALEGLPDISGL
jgi:hypothetical protein